jgi:MFS transporter, ACS family, DAL5 transporter family protein
MTQSLKESAKALHIKADVQLVESTEGSISSNVDERALLRKMDMQFIPWLSFLYFLSFLDRTSIGNAKVSVS